jgi:predicted nucleic acid-binding protein
MRDGDEEALERVALLLDHFPNVSVAPLTRRAARYAAKIIASHGLATPDALVVGTALDSGCAAVIGNDKRWLSRFEAPRYIALADHV